MTKDKTIQLLQSDAIFALSFVADNNPNGAVAVLAANGYYMPSTVTDTKSFVFDTLVDLLNSDKAKAIQIVSQIPYDKSANAPLYTQGFNDYFMRSQPASQTTAAGKFSLDALFAGLGTGLSTYSGVSLANNGMTTGGTTSTVDQAAQDAANAEAKRKKTNLIIGLTVGGLVVLGVIIYFVTKKKDN